eukprot:509350-Rhodomonas_salina.4
MQVSNSVVQMQPSSQTLSACELDWLEAKTVWSTRPTMSQVHEFQDPPGSGLGANRVRKT